MTRTWAFLGDVSIEFIGLEGGGQVELVDRKEMGGYLTSVLGAERGFSAILCVRLCVCGLVVVYNRRTVVSKIKWRGRMVF